MSHTVVIVENPLAPQDWEHVHDVEDVPAFIKERLGTWVEGTRLYAGQVSALNDVTPRSEQDVDALYDMQGPFYVVKYPQGPLAIIVGLVAVLAVAAAIFLRPPIPSTNNQARSANNQLSERTNEPRPNNRIADIYGTVRSTPDLLSVPFRVFQDHQELEVSYMLIGRGHYDVTDVRDDLTPVSSIPGASVEVYGPNTSPNTPDAPQLSIGDPITWPVQTVKRITSVNGQTLEPGGPGEWVGPFVVDLRGMKQLILNVVAPQGMFKDDGEDQFSTSVNVEAEVVLLDDADQAIGAPLTFTGTVAGSATSRDQRALTMTCNLGALVRRKARVRMRRTTPKDTVFDGTVVDEVRWRDCYGVAPVGNVHFGDVTTVLALTYATEGALAVKDRKLNMLVTRKLPARTGDFEFAGPLEPTNDAARIICHMASDDRIGRLTLGPIGPGEGGEVDVPQIYQAVADVVDYFGIEEAGQFNYTFDDADLSFQEMVQIVAMAVFSEPYRRGSVLRLRPELPQPDSVLLFNHRNKVPDSETRTVSFGSADNYDGVALKYVDPTDDVQMTLYVPQGDNTAVNPLEVTAFGVRSFEQAYLLAWRRWNRIKYQYLSEEFEALQEADLLTRNDRVLVADTSRSTLVDGEVLEQDGLVLTLSQQVDLDPAVDYTCFLQLPNGTVEALGVVQGASPWEVVLEAAPSVPLVVAGEGAYVSGFVITTSEGDGSAVPCLVAEKAPSDGFTVELTCVNYDARYYQNDLDFRNAEGEEPAPDPSGPTNPGGGTPDPGVSVTITPPTSSTASTGPTSSRTFTVNVTGGTATSYAWGVDSGAGTVVGASNGPSAVLKVSDYDPDDGEPEVAQFFCDVTIAGVVYRAFCTMVHLYYGDTRFDPR